MHPNGGGREALASAMVVNHMVVNQLGHFCLDYWDAFGNNRKPCSFVTICSVDIRKLLHRVICDATSAIQITQLRI